MDKIQAKDSIKKLQSECASLNPSSLIELFEINIGDEADRRGISVASNQRIFRFHNNIKLINTSIFFGNNEFIAAPIQAQGFEVSSAGTLATPTLSITVNEQAIPLLSLLKQEIVIFGDLVGCQVTRRRTFAKYIDATNFLDGIFPQGWEANPFVEFPKDLYFINRKTRENKLIIEYELNSVLDLENIQLPRRQMISQRCNFCYRGDGCLYEFSSRKSDIEHGESTVLPLNAPPIATEEDKKISDILGVSSLTNRGKYSVGNSYSIGHYIYITIDDVNYYFVSKINNNTNQPPNGSFWIADACSKSQEGCKLRWDTDGSVDVSNTVLTKGELPFGGFPSIQRLKGNYY